MAFPSKRQEIREQILNYFFLSLIKYSEGLDPFSIHLCSDLSCPAKSVNIYGDLIANCEHNNNHSGSWRDFFLYSFVDDDMFATILF